MGHKRILAALLAAAALFGAAVSGCNRSSDTDMAGAARGRRSQSQMQAEIDERVSVRPAEVLAASAHRNPRRRSARRQDGRLARQQYEEARREQRRRYAQAPRYPQYVQSHGLAQYEPLPEPVPVSELYASRPSAYQLQSGPGYASSGAAPVYNQTSVPVPQYAATPFISEPYTLVPSQTQPGFFEKVYVDGDGREVAPVRVVHPSPELTMARAQLQGSAPLAVPLPTPESFPAPIPELEPIRYSRASFDGRPVSAAPAAPVGSVAPAMRGWVASPSTAMRIVN